MNDHDHRPDREPGPPPDPGRCRPPAVWQLDCLLGPRVGSPERGLRPTCMAVLLDEATGVVHHAAFACADDRDASLHALRAAVALHGAPRLLCTDRGVGLHAPGLPAACAELGIRLARSAPFQRCGTEAVERFFRTLRRQFLARLCPADRASLDRLNRALQDWLESECRAARRPEGA